MMKKLELKKKKENIPGLGGWGLADVADGGSQLSEAKAKRAAGGAGDARAGMGKQVHLVFRGSRVAGGGRRLPLLSAASRTAAASRRGSRARVPGGGFRALNDAFPFSVGSPHLAHLARPSRDVVVKSRVSEEESSLPTEGEGGVRVLVVGGGGREHALVWGLARSRRCGRVYCAPGNAGIALEPNTVLLGKSDLDCDDHEAVVQFCEREGVSLVVIGPEAELVAGLADALRSRGIRAFGPSRAAAQLEGSKTFMKDVCRKYGIPTASYEAFDEAEAALSYLRRPETSFPIVVKADGLAAGKGVVIAQDLPDAEAAVESMLLGKQFGDAGASVVIEDFLAGEEASFFVIVDANGTSVKLHSAQDHKAAYDGDVGPNTGGMGAYSPAPVVTERVEAEVMSRVVEPLVRGLREEGCPFQGVIFAGLMIDGSDVKVLEFNVRFGDPECEVLLYRMRSDLLDLVLAACDGALDDFGEIEWDEDPALVVVMAARGYPGSYEKGTLIDLPTAVSSDDDPAKVFHANTKSGEGGEVLAAGGRVLAVAAKGGSVGEAQRRAYEAVDAVDWPEGFCRRDIGWRAVEREEKKGV